VVSSAALLHATRIEPEAQEPRMKTLSHHVPSHVPPAARPAGRIGLQLASVLLAVLVTPATLPTPDVHADGAHALDRGAMRRPHG
jgi:hypothetical protein